MSFARAEDAEAQARPADDVSGRARGTGGERARRRAPRARLTRGLTFPKTLAFTIPRWR